MSDQPTHYIEVNVELINSPRPYRKFTNVKEWRQTAEGVLVICNGDDHPVHFIPAGQYALLSATRTPV